MICIAASRWKLFTVVAPFSMSFDASPWGAGGFLVVDGSVRSWFSTAFTSVDEQAVGLTFGGCTSQQVAEAFANSVWT